MSSDISAILNSWPVEDPAVRVIQGVDGRPKIQRRLPLGLLQFELEGRPDGVRPSGFDSYFDYLKHMAQGAGEEFQLGHDECQSLAAEALLYYQRRLCFFELGNYKRAASDAERNLEVFAFARSYASDEDDARLLDQYRGFVIYHRARAESLDSIEQQDFGAAVESIVRGRVEIEEFYREYGLSDQIGDSDEIQQLEALRQRIEELRPRDRREQLEEKLNDAIRREQYELAAEIRDQIRLLGQ
ncbi:UvrB/uvrC motif protein [Planctomycetes bacterium Pan216]|uniref:UvrB/uvrC motif protein n=1 Tax=Kolteria novifilia TaxID=2527975 RepID=A0A518B1W6_9BACT|nr:UvrB/uvrC motif protein [Planctomycetes bacterium Pan216]